MQTLDTELAWRKYFADVGLRDDVSFEHVRLAGKQLAAHVPVIFDVEHLAKLLGVSDAYIASAVSASSFHYRTFTIPKRRGGLREISSPRSALKSVQRWILENILYSVEPHSSAVGFRRKKSILDHACVHNSSIKILKLDIADFFSSISLSRVIGVFKGFGYSPGVAFTLASLCCLDGVLPQGAVTSPALSNLVCRRMDVRLSALSRKMRLKFSRYADDMAISGRKLDLSVLPLIEKILREEGFVLRSDKTRLYDECSKRVLTGLSAARSGVKLLRSDRRQLRATFHQIRKFGLLSYVSNHKVRDPVFLDRLIGRLSFWCFIEPRNEFAREALQYLMLQKKELRLS